MTRDKKLYTLYLYFGLNFIATGMSTFAPKFYGEIGLSDGRIGLISSVMAFVALFAQPLWGMLADRAKYKRSVIALALALGGGVCFLVLPAAGCFAALLAMLTLYNTLCLPSMPVGSAIAIEYTSARGKSFGPVRMMGTIGYQVGILIAGFVLAGSLRGLYPLMGGMLMLAAGAALLLPDVRGHQHARQKTPITAFLKDRELMLLLTVVFLGHIGHQFNLSFFSKHLGDLGIGNTVTGFINVLAVALEIPFLLVGDRLMKRLSIWSWLTVGLLIGAVRFALLSVLRAPAGIVLAQMLSIAHLACFEFFPMMHLGRIASPELQASAQSLNQMISFGIARIVGSLVGGLIADAAGIPTVYGLCGALMLVTAVAFYPAMRKRAKASA